MRQIDISQLIPGMVVADNVKNYNDQIILPVGYKLTDKAITKLAFYSIPHIFIEDGPVTRPKPPDQMSHSERIKNNPEFQRFVIDFEENVQNFKTLMNNVVRKHASLNIDELLQDTLKLLDQTNGSIHIFEILSNMRQYDDSTYAHSINVALLSNILADWLGMSTEEKNLVTQCGLLHDIGKLKIPEKIIKKPGKLTNEEFNIIKTHPIAGFEILSDYKLNPHIANVAMMHHERCDGSGYPLSLTADKIDKYAKIISIADVYDAMTSVRTYRPAMCPFKAIEILENEGLQKYDSKYILTFLHNVLNSYIMSHVRLSDGRIGQIIMVNKNRLSRPLLHCDSKYIDLSREPAEIFIEEII